MQEFRQQVLRQIGRKIEDLVSPSPLVASMHLQIEDLVSPTPLVTSMRAQIANVRRNEERARCGGFPFSEEFRIQEVS